jgi:hypothetical protein
MSVFRRSLFSSRSPSLSLDLLKDATATSSRVASLSSRVSAVEQMVPAVQSIYAKSRPSHFYGGVKGNQELNRVDPGHQALFVPENIPAPIARVRAMAQPPPQLAILDSFAGKSCLAQYSDPSFFFGQWLKTEEEKAQKLMEENQAKKAARKKKKKKTNEKKPKMVAAVQVKTYSAQGREFDEQQRQLAAQRAAQAGQTGAGQAASPDEYEEEDERAGPSSSGPGVRMQAPQYDYSANQQQTNYINSLPPQQQQQQQQQNNYSAPPSPASQHEQYAPPAPAPPPGQSTHNNVFNDNALNDQPTIRTCYEHSRRSVDLLITKWLIDH